MSIVKPLDAEQQHLVAKEVYRAMTLASSWGLPSFADYPPYGCSGNSEAEVEARRAALRILSAIDPTAIAAEARRKALEEAAQAARNRIGVYDGLRAMTRGDTRFNDLCDAVEEEMKVISDTILALINTAPVEE